MKNLALMFCLIWVLAISAFGQICNETGSYNEIWDKQSRLNENEREKREKLADTLTQEQKERISSFEIYPTNLMICGMGFSDGLAKIFVNGRAGFINTKGEIVIRPQYGYAGRFSENLAPVQFENGKWGYVNKKGLIVIKPAFSWALIFCEGRALVQVNEKWGFIDSIGQMVIASQFDHAGSFSEGLAKVEVWGIDALYGANDKVLKTGYVDKSGNWIIKPIWDGGMNFQSGKALVYKHLVDESDKKTYFGCFWIDQKGNKIGAELENCSGFSDEPNLLNETEIELVFEGYKTGYKNKTGEYVWKPTK